MTTHTIANFNEGDLGKPDSEELWVEIISHIPESVLKNKKSKFLFPAIGFGSELIVLGRLLHNKYGWTLPQIKNACYGMDKRTHRVRPFWRSGFKNIIRQDFLEWETDMKFDVVLGNPPFQDGNKEGGQNKIYNFFAKKSLTLLKPGGKVILITPTSVCKKSKRFSLVDQQGLKLVNFLANDYFSVGAKICYWYIDRSYSGQVTVIHKNGTDAISAGEAIYDYGEVDKKFSKLYTALREATKSPSSRMFKHNAIDMSKCRSPEKTKTHVYPIYKLHSDGQTKFIQYNSVKPKLYQKKKLVVAITKSFKPEMTTVDTRDYDMAHLSTEVLTDREEENIKSFIFSDYFMEHVKQWKQVDGYGYNYALLYLPIFDKTKHWTNNEVKTFIESFLDN